MNRVGPREECADSLGVRMSISRDHLTDRSQRGRRGIAEHPSQRCGHANGLPAARGLCWMDVLPFMKLELGRHRRKWHSDFRAKVKRLHRDALVELLEVGKSLVGAARRFLPNA